MHGREERRVTAPATDVERSARVDQGPHDGSVTAGAREQQGGLTVLVSCVRVSTRLEQGRRDARIGP